MNEGRVIPIHEMLISNYNAVGTFSSGPGAIELYTGLPEPVIVIKPDGAILWKGREVETDDDFRAAMMDLATNLKGELKCQH